MNKIVVSLLLSALLVSCAAAPPKYSQTDVASATTREQQVALYSSLAEQLAADPKSTHAATYQQLMTELGTKLGNETESQIRSMLEKAKQTFGQVPLSILNGAEADAEPMRYWSPEKYTLLIAELRRDRDATHAALSSEIALVETLNSSADLVAQVESLRRIRDWRGDDVDADRMYNVAYESAQDHFRLAGDQALQNDDYESALKAYNSLKRIDPDYPDIDRLIANTRSGMESFDFLQLLFEGDIEGAYAAFITLSERQMTPAQKSDFMHPAGTLADYMASSAAKLVEAGQYGEAYAMIKREMAIRAWMKEPSQVDFSTINQFTKAMFDLSVASSARDYFGLEYGYLLLAEEFDPSYSTLERRLQEAEKAVYNGAIRRVEPVTIISTDPANQNIAAQIAAGVREYLMVNIPDDVKIVEREKLDDVMRERVLTEDSIKNRQVSELESADYLIQGDLLTAQVITTVKTIKNTERVVTGETEAPNPAFEAFIKEKGKRKADSPEAPPRTIMQPTMEDISLNIEEHQKDGEVGVTYRVIDSLTAEHLHSNSISKPKRVSDQAREGVRLGTHIQEPKLAELPSDTQILNTLADEVVVAMAKDLVEFLVNPTGDYFEICKRQANEMRFQEAAESCGNAAVLRKFKAQDNTEVVALLKTVTLNSGMRTD